MRCSEAQQLLSAYHDDELADDDRSRLSDHLGVCSACAEEVAGFATLSSMAKELGTPNPPDHIWHRLEKALDEQSSSTQSAVSPVEELHGWSVPAKKLLALAATIFVLAGIGWFTYQSSPEHGEHDEFSANFGHYLETFRHDPVAAQQMLLAQYENQPVEPELAIQQIGYRPSVADGLPAGYALESTHVMKMPCCTCVQSLCKRSDGSVFAIFEHDDDETSEWFSDRPTSTAICGNTQCSVVDLEENIAATWKRGSRHITLIGARDVTEVNDMVAWLVEKKQAIPN